LVHLSAAVTAVVVLAGVGLALVGREAVDDGVIGVFIATFCILLYGAMWVDYLQGPAAKRTVAWSIILFVPAFGSLTYYLFAWRREPSLPNKSLEQTRDR
jgi:apolipoprotein N-acyltransferase